MDCFSGGMKSETRNKDRSKGNLKEVIEQKHNFSGSEKTMARSNNAKTCSELSLHYTIGC